MSAAPEMLVIATHDPPREGSNRRPRPPALDRGQRMRLSVDHNAHQFNWAYQSQSWTKLGLMRRDNIRGSTIVSYGLSPVPSLARTEEPASRTLRPRSNIDSIASSSFSIKSIPLKFVTAKGGGEIEQTAHVSAPRSRDRVLIPRTGHLVESQAGMPSPRSSFSDQVGGPLTTSWPSHKEAICAPKSPQTTDLQRQEVFHLVPCSSTT